MALELSTAGIRLKFTTEATAGVRPTSGYTPLSGVKRIGELNPAPSNLDATDLSDEEWKRYIPGLKDPGGAWQIGTNMSTQFLTQWETVVSNYDNVKDTGKALWFEVAVPGLAKSFFIRGIPQPLGMNGAETDSVFENNVYIMPNGPAGWFAKST